MATIIHFDISADDLQRAEKFYEKLLDGISTKVFVSAISPILFLAGIVFAIFGLLLNSVPSTPALSNTRTVSRYL